MGGISSYHSFSSPNSPNMYRSSIPKSTEGSKRWGFHSGYGGYGMGYGHPAGHGYGHSYAAPYGHPITHPGFTTIGFPGHAFSTLDVRKNIAKKEKSRSKRQVPVFPAASSFMPAAVPAAPAISPFALHQPLVAASPLVHSPLVAAPAVPSYSPALSSALPMMQGGNFTLTLWFC